MNCDIRLSLKTGEYRIPSLYPFSPLFIPGAQERAFAICKEDFCTACCCFAQYRLLNMARRGVLLQNQSWSSISEGLCLLFSFAFPAPRLCMDNYSIAAMQAALFCATLLAAIDCFDCPLMLAGGAVPHFVPYPGGHNLISLFSNRH